MKHDIPFNTVSKDFNSRDEVLIWIIRTQIARRNLTPIQLSHFRGLHYRADRRIVTNQGGKNQYSEVVPQNGEQPQSTSVRLANQYNVSKNTIQRDARVSHGLETIREMSPEAERMILSGEVGINRNTLEMVPQMQEAELRSLISEIESGTFKRRQTATAPTVAQPPEMSTPTDMGPFEQAITKITDELFSELRKQNSAENPAGLKTALRSYINMLEDLYSQI